TGRQVGFHRIPFQGWSLAAPQAAALTPVLPGRQLDRGFPLRIDNRCNRPSSYVLLEQCDTTQISRKFRLRKNGNAAAGLPVAALVGAGDAVVPAEVVVVEDGPEEAQTERQRRQQQGADTVAHGGAAGVFVLKGAERDLCVAHAGGRSGPAEEHPLI